MNKDTRPEALKKANPTIIAAARDGNLNAVMYLVRDGGIPVDFQDAEGSPTALMTAAFGGFVEIIMFLLNPGPDIKPAEINKQDREQRTALINAVLNNKADCVVLLMESGADPNLFSKNGWTPLYIAANKGYTEIAKTLLFQYGSNSPKKNTSYHTLNVDMTIQNGVGGSVLMIACMQGHYEIVKSLLESGADVNVKDKQDWTALMKAADKGNVDIVKLLLGNGADVLAVDRTGVTALHLAARAGKPDVIDAFLSQPRIEVNAVDNKNQTPLYLAVEKKHLEAVRTLLLDARVDVTIAERVKGGTALTIATPTHSPEIHALLHAAPRVSGQKAADAVVAGRTEELRRQIEGLKISTITLASKKRKSDSSYPDGAAILPTFLQLDADYTSWRWLGDAGAVDRILAAAEAGDPSAHAYASLLFGYGCCKFPVSAVSAHEHAKLAMSWLAFSSSSTARFLLGSFLYDGIGHAPHEERALELLQEAAADKTHANAMYALALFYQEADPTPQNVFRAYDCLHAAAEKSHPHALFDLGYCHLTGFGGVDQKDPVKAVQYFKEAAALNHEIARINLGTLYWRGSCGVEKNELLGVGYFQDAADRKHPLGIYKRAVCYQQGVGGVKDLTKAAELLQEAARLGCAPAQVALGVCFCNGTGVVRVDESEAARFFRMAAEQGDADGLYWYAWSLAKGRGGVHNPAQALTCYRRAADQGHVCAKIELACMLVQVVNTVAARAEAKELLSSVGKCIAEIVDAVPVFMPVVTVEEVDAYTRLRTTNRYELSDLDASHCSDDLSIVEVELTAQDLLRAAPLLKYGLLLLKLSDKKMKPPYLDLALSIIADPPMDCYSRTFDKVYPTDSEGILLQAFDVLQNKRMNVKTNERDSLG